MPLWSLSRKQYPKEYFLWNFGMFMFKAEVLTNELATHSSVIINLVNNATNNATQDLDFIRLAKQAFVSYPSDSVDYALREKSDNVIVVPLYAQ